MAYHPFLRAATAASTVLLALPAHALAADLGERTPLHLSGDGADQATSSGGSSIVRTVVGLAIVIAVIYGLAWVLRQVKRSREARGQGTGLTPCAVVPLGSGRSLQLVRAGREYVLVGVAENAVTPIRTYTEAEALALGLDVEPEPAVTVGPPRIAGLLDALRERTVRP